MRNFSALVVLVALPLCLAFGGCSPGPKEGSPGSGGATADGGGPAVGGSSVGGSSASGSSTSSGGEKNAENSGGTSTGGATNDGGSPSDPTGGAGGTLSPSGGATNASGGSDPSGSGGAPDELPLTIFLAGDSTVSTYADTASTTDQAGWGQMLHEYLSEKAKVDNRAIGGRTARRFIDEGALDKIWDDAEAGDYLFVQFGTNDGNKTATYELNGQTIPYYLDPNTDFKTYLMQYVEGARAREVTPVFVTPPPRNSAYCTGGNGTGAHAQAIRELGEAEDVAVLDLNEQSVAYLTAICPAPTPEDFFLLRGDGSVDGTHFQENGARKLAGFVASELEASSLPLAASVQ